MLQLVTLLLSRGIKAIANCGPDLNLVIRWLEDETIPMPDALFLSSPTAKVLWLQRLQLRILDGVLYYIWLMKIDK